MVNVKIYANQCPISICYNYFKYFVRLREYIATKYNKELGTSYIELNKAIDQSCNEDYIISCCEKVE